MNVEAKLQNAVVSCIRALSPARPARQPESPPRGRFRALLALALSSAVLGVLAPPLQAAPGDPLGSAFRVDVDGISGFQPLIARNAAGDFVVLWAAAPASLPEQGWRMHARLYSANGTPKSAPLLLEPGPTAGKAALAIDGAGNFIVSWLADLNTRIDFQRVSADGTPIGGVQSLRPAARLSGHALAMNPSGEFVLVWRQSAGIVVPMPIFAGGYGSIRIAAGSIVARRYSADGTPLGKAPTLIRAELTAPAAITGGQSSLPPAAGIDAAGNVVVAWIDATPRDSSIMARRIHADGKPAGPAFTVSGASERGASHPLLSMSPDGDFAVAYTARHMIGADSSSGTDVYLRRYGADGEALGAGRLMSERVVTSSPALASGASGNAVVAWTDTQAPTCCASPRLRFQLVAPDGSKIGGNTQAEENVVSDPAVAADASGNFVLIWNRGMPPTAVLEARMFSGY